MNAFIESQFSYCPLVWMFCHSRRLNKRINHIHERGLRIVYEDYTSSFSELLKINGSVSIHHRNIQLVAIVMFKVKNGLCPEIMRDLFQLNTNPNSQTTFVIPLSQRGIHEKAHLKVLWSCCGGNNAPRIVQRYS